MEVENDAYDYMELHSQLGRCCCSLTCVEPPLSRSRSARRTASCCSDPPLDARRDRTAARRKVRHLPARNFCSCTVADSDEAGRVFRLKAATLFRSEAGHHSEAMAAGGGVVPAGRCW